MPVHNNYYPFALFQGSIRPLEECNIPITTNALHYGGGVFAGIKIYKVGDGHAVFRLDDHIRRMKNSCKILRFPFEFDEEKVKKHIIDLAQNNKVDGTTYIRPIIYRSDTRLSPDISGEYDIAIYMLKLERYLGNDDGLSVCVSSWQRNSDNALPPLTKATGGYINSALAIHDAKQAGFDSAIMLDQQGKVGEGAVMNIFLVKDGKLTTPALESDILEGITRRTVMEIAKDLDIDIIERIINRSELYNADEVFFCGTAVEIAWCKSVDNVVVSEKAGDVTIKIQKAFKNLPKTRKELFTSV